MLIRLPTPKGTLEIELNDREAPLASRCFQYQILKKTWSQAEFHPCPDGIKLVGSTFTPEIGLERTRKFTKGCVAFGSSTNELVFCLVGQGSEERTVVGSLVPHSLSKLDPPLPRRSDVRAYDA